MSSLRARVLVAVLGLLAVAALLVGGVTYRNVRAETEALFDYQLRQMALSLRNQGEVAPAQASALADEQLDFVVQVWSVDAALASAAAGDAAGGAPKAGAGAEVTAAPLVALALSVPTVVSRWFTLAPMPVPATRRKALAVTSWSASLVSLFAPTSASASTMLPAVAVMLTLPSVSSRSPTVTSVAAINLAVASAPVLRNTLVALCVIDPVPANTSMLPLLAAVLVVRMSAVPVKPTLSSAITLTFPLPLTMSALAVTSLPAPCAWISTLPLPWALTAVSSVGFVAVPGAVPLSSVIEPAVVRITT